VIASPHPQKRSPLLIPKNDRHAPKIAPSQNDRLSSFPEIAMPQKLLLPKTIAPPDHQKAIALGVPIPSNGNFKP